MSLANTRPCRVKRDAPNLGRVREYPSASAFPAKTDNGRVRKVRAESVLTFEALRQRLEHAHRDLLLRSALSADQVPVRAGVGATPARDAVIKMRMSHVPKPLERFEISVDGRWIDLWIARADRARDLLRGRVVARAAEHVENEPALHGHAHAPGAHVLGDTHSCQRDAIASVLQDATIAGSCDNLAVWTSVW